MYRCPNCQKQTEVSLEQAGKVAQCKSCDMPFRPELLAGRQLTKREDGSWVATTDAVTGLRGSGEKAVMTVRPAMFRTHPFKFISMICVFILGVTGMIIFGAQVSGLETWWRPLTLALSVGCAIGSAIAMFWIVIWFMRTHFESLTITSERTIWERGIFDRSTSEVQHDDIRNIQIDQALLDRMLGVGRIAISSAGQDDMEIDIQGIPEPQKVADAVRQFQARMEGRGD